LVRLPFPLFGLFYHAALKHSVLLIYFSGTTLGLLVQDVVYLLQ